MRQQTQGRSCALLPTARRKAGICFRRRRRLAPCQSCFLLPAVRAVQVPVLVDGELQITESPVVAEYVLRRYGAETGGRIACSCPDARKMAGAAARGCLQP